MLIEEICSETPSEVVEDIDKAAVSSETDNTKKTLKSPNNVKWAKKLTEQEKLIWKLAASVGSTVDDPEVLFSYDEEDTVD